MATVKGIPEGFHSLTPSLICRDAPRSMDFYKRAFGATELSRHLAPNGKIMNAQMRIGDSVFMLMEENLEWEAPSPLSLNGTPVSIQIYVEDADKLFNQAVAAGATVSMPMEDAFWGDRFGSVTDPSGHSWSISTRVKDLSPDELKRASDAALSKMQNA